MRDKNLTKINFIDLEMLCWGDKPVGEIIQVGVCQLDLKDNTLKTDSYYVKPSSGIEVSEYCTQLTGITNKQVYKQGRPLEDVMKTVFKKYGKNYIFAAWGRDDKTLAKEGIVLDNYLNYAMLFRAKYGEGKVGQKSAQLALGIPFSGRQHDAGWDAYNLANLFIVAEDL